jgi:uncharacterized protein YjbI with pentapeptide repeats
LQFAGLHLATSQLSGSQFAGSQFSGLQSAGLQFCGWHFAGLQLAGLSFVSGPLIEYCRFSIKLASVAAEYADVLALAVLVADAQLLSFAFACTLSETRML